VRARLAEQRRLVSALSPLRSLVSSHWAAAWQPSRVEVKQEAEANKRDGETPVEHKVVEQMVQDTEIERV
jgi:hypothetical protein